MEKNISTLETVLYAVCKERFGLTEVRNKKERPVRKCRRHVKIQQIRSHLKQLLKQDWKTGEVERDGLSELRNFLRKETNNFQKAERLRLARKERTKKRNAFVANPYKFTSTNLEGKKSGKLRSSKEFSTRPKRYSLQEMPQSISRHPWKLLKVFWCKGKYYQVCRRQRDCSSQSKGSQRRY